ncbi:MAG: hypothetical protein ABWY96_02295, partial [Gaiellaceae bacterium]
MTSTADRLVEDYLRSLDRELSGLPRARRRELTEQIASHIAEARAGLENEDEAEIRNLLDRLGEPAEIAEEARERAEPRPRRAGWMEILALILLLIGGIVLPVVGWFVGVVLLWVSDAWTTREKLVGTFVIPGGLATPLLLGGLAVTAESCSTEFDPMTGAEISSSCTGGSFQAADVLGPVLAVVLLLAPVFTTIFLARRL